MKDKKGFISRLGGDEFVIILEGIHHIDEVTLLAEKILQIINRPIHIKDIHYILQPVLVLAFFRLMVMKEESYLKEPILLLIKERFMGKISIICSQI